MSDLTIFAFDSAAVRTLDLNGEPWFVATDIAKILGYRNAPDMVRMLDEDEKGTHNLRTPSSNQHGEFEYAVENTIISESGLYAAILKSRRPEAKAFRKWVTSEVLPAIRKRGSYTVPGADPVPRFITNNLAHGADLAVAADRTFRSFLRAARSAGMALPQALRTANRQTAARTGVNMLEELALDPDTVTPVPLAGEGEDISPEFESLSDWVQNECIPWHRYRLGDIAEHVFGIKGSSARFRSKCGEYSRMLRQLGMKRGVKRNEKGRQFVAWWIERGPAPLD